MEFINVLENRGVYGDGIHDDTKALQNCIDTLKSGGTIYFPDGVYLLSATLIFYSHQTLKFSDGAVMLRSPDGDPLTRYLLASYSEPAWGGYTGTHHVVISGGIFDGNKNLNERSTLLNTVHCSNILIENCTFRHCGYWHCIELNGTKDTVIQNCVFDGPSYTHVPENIYNEQIQLDLCKDGSYGPVYNCDGQLIDFCKDETVCRDITIRSNIFKCDGFPAIGHHDPCEHHNIDIENNIFHGPMGRDGKTRGYIFFRPPVYDVRVASNAFIAPEETNSPAMGIITENPDTASLTEEDNVFIGHFDEKLVYGIR